ncbi:bifunctional folylpolyglutamate synthase/dihydrofolate synthase [candidate division WOR-3 bacterium]|nr:bifunctional folylpolyglutamate synthase/dihydrofolate synthase [candidate division WOR-3 bacterium]
MVHHDLHHGVDFKKALEFIYSFKDWERGRRYEFNLSSFHKFLKKIDYPHSQLKRPILIAGTKGKGSTAHILSSIFKKVGKTGTFTSPHLVNIRERIKINDQPIPESDFVQLLEKMKPYLTSECSTYEILTSLAFTYFAREKTDFSIFEVGLGGRLDATNVLTPEVSILTPISFDHTKILGHTLTSIANEKCGIIKEGGQVISSPQAPEVLEVIKKACQDKKTTLQVIGEDLFCEDIECDLTGSRFKISPASPRSRKWEVGSVKRYELPLLGRHQIINALTSICTARVCNIPDTLIKEGLREVKSSGRLEIINKNPWIVFDGAHNVASAWVLRRAIIELFNFRHLILIFGVLKDKDKEGIIQVLSPITDYTYVTSLKSERSANPEDIFQLFKQKKVQVQITQNTESAFHLARQRAQPDDLILATGSLYLIGELLAL